MPTKRTENSWRIVPAQKPRLRAPAWREYRLQSAGTKSSSAQFAARAGAAHSNTHSANRLCPVRGRGKNKIKGRKNTNVGWLMKKRAKEGEDLKECGDSPPTVKKALSIDSMKISVGAIPSLAQTRESCSTANVTVRNPSASARRIHMKSSFRSSESGMFVKYLDAIPQLSLVFEARNQNIGRYRNLAYGCQSSISSAPFLVARVVMATRWMYLARNKRRTAFSNGEKKKKKPEKKECMYLHVQVRTNRLTLAWTAKPPNRVRRNLVCHANSRRFKHALFCG